MGGGGNWKNVRCLVALGGLGQLNLHPVDAVDAVNEEDENEDEGNLQTVLELRDEGVLGDETVVARFRQSIVAME